MEERTKINTLGRDYFHICSDGNYSSVLFNDQDDFKAAMNRIAVCTLRIPVSILAFVLMDNHFHFVIRSSEDDAIKFANEFKRLTGTWFSRKKIHPSGLIHLPVKVIHIEDSNYLKAVLCYVIKNPIKARLGMFYDYPWGSGSLYFRTQKRLPEGVLPAGTYTKRGIRELCRTRTNIPDDWLISDGLILPENYVSVSEAEQLLRTYRAYMYFLSLNKDDAIDGDMGEWNELQLTDSELRVERNIFIKQRFAQANITKLNAEQRLLTARHLRRKYLCSKGQIARIVLLPYETVCKHL